MDELVVQGEISNRILTLRSKQVMLERPYCDICKNEPKMVQCI